MLPYFYHPALAIGQQETTLDEATSKHCIQVLRMNVGEQLLLTDGRGLLAQASIAVPDRKHCRVCLARVDVLPPRPRQLTLAVAFTKNSSRNEWLLEKATELGVEHIVPISCKRSEKDKFNQERWQGILVSAMLQSQQAFLPKLHPVLPFGSLPSLQVVGGQHFIAHCIGGGVRRSYTQSMDKEKNAVILIGPEGDFTEQEVAQALAWGFAPVVMGPNRLRTETAALYACTVFNALVYG
ncbi:MAG: RsmE family RNA methyltransferase [Edaphocola sp.]